MPTYAYQAVDGSGKRTRGRAQAVSSGALTRTLEERGLFVLDVAESAEGAATRAAGFDSAAGARCSRSRARWRRCCPWECRSPRRSTPRRASRAATCAPRCTRCAARVERGDTLSSALAEHPQLFSPLYVGLVRAGERSGDIDSRVRAAVRSARARRAAARQGAVGVDLSDAARRAPARSP